MKPDDLLPDDYLAAVLIRCRRFSGCWDAGTSGSLAADAFRLLRERKVLMSTIEELERWNADLRAARDERVAGSCCEGVPACRSIDTRGPLVDPDQVAADDDAIIDPECSAGMTQEAAEAAWAAVKARYEEMHERIAPPAVAEPPRARVFSAAGPTTTADAFPSPAEELLRTAAETVRERRATYGPPTAHFRVTIDLLNAAFTSRIKSRLAAGEPPFRIDDWPIIMILDKIARDRAGPKQSADTPIDLAGYAATLAETRA